MIVALRDQISKGAFRLRGPRRFENGILNGLHVGQPCYVLATGPSINDEPMLGRLKGSLCIGVSGLFLSPIFDIVKPQYHCFAPWHSPLTEAQFDARFASYFEQSHRPITVMGLSDRKRMERCSLESDRKIHYLSLDSRVDIDNVGRIDLTRSLMAPQSVSVMALQLAIGMGCDPIVLLGCDHDTLLNVGISRHCYAESEDPVVRLGATEWTASDLEAEFRGYLQLWRQYKALRRVAEAAGQRIINATLGGMLDLFERQTLAQILPAVT